MSVVDLFIIWYLLSYTCIYLIIGGTPTGGRMSWICIRIIRFINVTDPVEGRVV